MNYYFDTEFLEGPQAKKLFGIKYGETKPTIDLISIGIVAKDGGCYSVPKEYYAISKEFNLDEAWNRWQRDEHIMGDLGKDRRPVKEYWIRENVLRPIFHELLEKARAEEYKANHYFASVHNVKRLSRFTISNMEHLLDRYGKSNKKIAEEIKLFVGGSHGGIVWKADENPVFYAYYADYDWVVFCWLFGTMMDLPEGFPMYCKDLKQIMDDKANTAYSHLRNSERGVAGNEFSISTKLEIMKACNNYPKQENEHNALADAQWNKKLHEFLKSI